MSLRGRVLALDAVLFWLVCESNSSSTSTTSGLRREEPRRDLSCNASASLPKNFSRCGLSRFKEASSASLMGGMYGAEAVRTRSKKFSLAGAPRITFSVASTTPKSVVSRSLDMDEFRLASSGSRRAPVRQARMMLCSRSVDTGTVPSPARFCQDSVNW